jgi:hypothetical protein
MNAVASSETQYPSLFSVLRNRNFALLWSGAICLAASLFGLTFHEIRELQ